MAPGHSLQTGFVRSDTGAPQQANLDASGNVLVSVVGGSGSAVSIADGSDVAEGTTTDPAWVSGAGTVISLLKKIASAGGSAVSIADGADATEGAITDAAVTTDSAGTISGKLRGLIAILASVWDSTAGRLKAAVVGSTRTVSGVVTVNGDTVTIDVTGMATVTILNSSASGGFDGHVIVQASNDAGVNYTDLYQVNAYNGYIAPLAQIPNAFTGSAIFPCAGYDTVKLTLTGRTVGAATYKLQASTMPWTYPRSIATIEGSAGNGAEVTGAGELRVYGQVSLISSTIKAPTVPAAAADTALVVAISPNNTVTVAEDIGTFATNVADTTQTTGGSQSYTVSPGAVSVRVTIGGGAAWVGTVTFNKQLYTARGIAVSATVEGVPVLGGPPVTSTTVNGAWVFPAAGLEIFLVDCAAVVSGLVGISITETFANELPVVGQTTMARSQPVTLASDQTALAVSGPLTDAELRATPVPVSGTVSATASADVYSNDGPGPNYAALATARNLTETFDGRLRVILDEQARNNLAQLELLSQILAVLRASHVQIGEMAGTIVDPGAFIGDSVH